jgi:hypothetical protein
MSAQRQSVDAQNHAYKLEAKQQALAAARSRRQAIREAMILRAQSSAAGQAVGATGSSGLAGGLGSLASQLGAEEGFASTYSGLSRKITRLNINAASLAGRASTLEGVANLAASGYRTSMEQGWGG